MATAKTCLVKANAKIYIQQWGLNSIIFGVDHETGEQVEASADVIQHGNIDHMGQPHFTSEIGLLLTFPLEYLSLTLLFKWLSE